MRCNQCGRETPSGLPNCIHCGYSFPRNTNLSSKNAPYYPQSNAQKNAFSQNQRAYVGNQTPVSPNGSPNNDSDNKGKLGIILGATIGGAILFVGIIIALIFAFGSGSGSNYDEQTVLLNRVYAGFEDSQETYMDGEYLYPDKIDEAMDSAYAYADSLVKQGIAESAVIEKENLSVVCRLKQGDTVIYVPRLKNTKAGGDKNRILTAQPFKKEFHNDTADEAAVSVQSGNHHFGFSKKDNLDDAAVNLDAIKRLKGAKVIIWDGHGGYDSFDHSFVSISVSYTDLKKSKEYGKYCDQIHICSSTEGNALLTPAFFKDFYKKGDFSGAVIYLGTCMSGYDTVLADTLRSKGAKTVFVNTFTTSISYDGKMMKSVFQEMAKGKTAHESLKLAKKTNGAKGPKSEYVGEKGRTVVNCLGDDTLTLDTIVASQQSVKATNFSSIEDYIKTYASNYAGGWMPMRGDGNNVYFSDQNYQPSGIYRFEVASGKTRQIVSLSKPEDGKVNLVEFYEKGVGVKSLDTEQILTDAISIYDHNGNQVAKAANTYVYEYDGKRVYSHSDTMVESWNAESDMVYNSDIDFDADNSPFGGASVMNVYTYGSKEFIELYYEGRRILITSVGNTYKEIAEIESNCFLNDQYLYYIKGNYILRIDLSAGDYKAAEFCAVDADYIYFVSGNHICYGKNSKNGAHFTAYGLDIGSSAYKIADDDCPMDGI